MSHEQAEPNTNAQNSAAQEDRLPQEATQQPTPDEQGGSPGATPEGQDMACPSDEVMDLISNVEQHLERIRSVQTDRRGEVSMIEQRRDEIEDRERALQRAAADLEARRAEFESIEASLAKRADTIDMREAELAESLEALESSKGDVDRREEELLESLDRFEKEHEEFELARAAHEEAAVAARDERDAIDRELKATRERLEEAERQRAELESALTEAREQLEALGAEHARFVEQKQALEATLRAERERFEQELAERDVLMGEQRAEAERFEQAAHAAADRIDTIQAELAEARRAAQAFETKHGELQQSVEELREEIVERERVAESVTTERDAFEEEIATMRSTLEERERQRNELQAKFDQAMKRLQALAEAVAEQGPKLEEGAAAAELADHLQRRVSQISEELEEARRELDRRDRALKAATGGKPGLDPRELEELRAALDEAEVRRREAEQRAQSLASSLQQLRAEAERAAEAAPAPTIELGAETRKSAVGDAEEIDEQLRERAQRIAEYADHLRVRRDRLARVRGRLHEMRQELAGAAKKINEQAAASRKSAQNGGTAIPKEQLERVEALRTQLEAKSRELVEAETEMRRRWAKPRAIATTFWVVLMLGGIAAGSWFGVKEFAPAPAIATAKLAGSAPAADAGRAEFEAWAEWNQALLTDELYAEAVLERVGMRLGEAKPDAAALLARFETDATLRFDERNGMDLAFTGANRHEAVVLADAMVTTLAAESNRQMRRRGDSIRAEPALGADGSVVTLEPRVMTEQDYMTAGIAGGGALVGCLALWGIVFTMLSRSRRVFEDEVAVV